jgi:hypothetical protein
LGHLRPIGLRAKPGCAAAIDPDPDARGNEILGTIVADTRIDSIQALMDLALA